MVNGEKVTYYGSAVTNFSDFSDITFYPQSPAESHPESIIIWSEMGMKQNAHQYICHDEGSNYLDIFVYEEHSSFIYPSYVRVKAHSPKDAKSYAHETNKWIDHLNYLGLYRDE
jgi:hypothetical protein